MKKISKLVLTLAVCFSSIFAFSLVNVKAEDEKEVYIVKNDPSRSTYEKVTIDGVSIQKSTLYFVIPKEAEQYNNVQLDLGQAMMSELERVINEYWKGWFMPGDYLSYEIVVENQSGVNYTYQENSLYVSDPDMKGGELANPWDIHAFDGELLDVRFVPYRLGNARAIYSGLFDLFNQHRVTGKMMFTIDEPLAALGYTGERALTQYLLDYYNNPKNGYNYDGINATKIEELDPVALRDIFSSGMKTNNNGIYTISDKDYNKLSDQQKAAIEEVLGSGGSRMGYRFRETEKELAEYYYNYFYNWCMGLQFGNYANNESANGDLAVRTVTTSSIMKMYNDVNGVRTTADSYIASQLTAEALKTGSSGTIKAGYTLDGPLTGNNAIDYDIDFNANITLQKEVTGTLEIEKTIDYGNYETSDNPFFLFKATNVDTGKVYYRVMALSDEMKSNTVVIDNLPLGNYTVEEFNPIRYSKETVKEVALTNATPLAKATFKNTKTKDNDFSDSDAIINSFTKNEDGTITITQKKVTTASKAD